MKRFFFCIAIAGICIIPLAAQNTPQPQTQRQRDNQPVYKVSMVPGSVATADYQTKKGKTKIAFKGTPLLPSAKGRATIVSKDQSTQINATFKGLKSPRKFQSEDLTYVLWAISPNGKPTNLGEMRVHNGKSRLHGMTTMPAFGLIVTAEPYFAVNTPSNVVVLENQIKPNSKLHTAPVTAKYELMPHKEYTYNAAQANTEPPTVKTKIPLEIYEARNAVEIAKQSDAQKYAPDTLDKAENQLTTANDDLVNKNKKTAIAEAREAVQTAADACLIAERHTTQQNSAQLQP